MKKIKMTRGMLAGASLLVLGTVLGACTEYAEQPLPKDYPTADPYLGEEIQPHEAERAAQIAHMIQEMLVTEWVDHDKHVPRDAHAKAHGCVKAEFDVDDNLPADLQHGVFQPGASYKSWIRYSNSAGNPFGDDYARDGRGMAIKLLGIDTKSLLPDPADHGTQDFVMISHPSFFVNDPTAYRAFMHIGNSTNIFQKAWRVLVGAWNVGVKGTITGLEITHLRIGNPLNQRYWSMVPYQLGTGEDRQAVKFSARACKPEAKDIPKDHGPNYLRTVMQDKLHEGPACMEFLVQPRTSPEMSVEDSVTEWTEEEAPFYKVATITIPQQTFNTPEQNTFCENLSYTPWHASEAHKPLGAVNRMRKVVYQHISKYRHNKNGVERMEPKPW